MKKSLGLFLLTIILSILLCGGVTYAYFQSLSYVSVKNYDQKEQLFTREEAKMAQSILQEFPIERYYVKEHDLLREVELLQEYRSVLEKGEDDGLLIINRRIYSEKEKEEILSRYQYSVSQVNSILKVYFICIQRFAYAGGYETYVSGVKERADAMMGVNLFSEGVKNKIIKTVKDFYGLENVRVQASLNVGVEQLFRSFFGIVISMICVLICSFAYVARYRQFAEGMKLSLRKGSGIGFYGLGIFLGCVGIFGAELIAVNASYGLESLSRPVQSMVEFRTSPFLISMGMLLGIRMLFQCCACLILFLFIVGLCSMEKKWMAFLIGGAVLCCEILLDVKGVPYSILGGFHVEKLLGTYDVAIMFEKSVFRIWIFSFIMIMILVCAFVFAGSGLKTAMLAAREKAEQKYFEEVDAKNAEARMLRHDMNNHLAAVAMLLQENKKDEAEEYLHQVLKGLEATKPPVRTGIGVLDGVLMTKEVKAKEKGIRLTMEIEGGLQSISMPDYELCSLFGNLLDNCLEACESLPEEKRWAKLRVSRQMEMFCVLCENPYDKLRREDGKLVTRKADSRNHGLGIQQMERIVKKHGGTMEIDEKDQIFTVSILFP